MLTSTPDNSRTRIKSLIKNLVMMVFVYVWSPCRNVWRSIRGRSHTVVLTYHRVNDEHKDAVTVGIEQFRRQMQILRKNFNLLDLQDFLSRHGQKNCLNYAVVTFDDGYADNYDAAIFLRSQNIPATFFLSTGIVGSDNPFPHDIRRLGKQIPSLSWSQVREMAEWGFSFGGHTVHHSNLGKLTTDDAILEVLTSCEDLRRELGKVDYPKWFAYPHGKAEDIGKDVLIEMTNSGIICCCSAYGGTNPPNFDRMNILRQSVNHQFSDLAFRALLQGWRVRA